LNYKQLLNLTLKAVATIIKRKSPEQLMALFNIEDKFTPEEYDALYQENVWIKENQTLHE
tara:strand:+ start:24 stop:203 length:180 start_codon:yes stop_codon:yes gene_type:complete